MALSPICGCGKCRAVLPNLFAHSVEEFLSSNHGAINYDFVVMADVIEHLARPDKVLAEFRRRIAPSTKVCVSTPNVAFVSVRIALLNGVFDDVDSGILERTHLRFFTLGVASLSYSRLLN